MEVEILEFFRTEILQVKFMLGAVYRRLRASSRWAKDSSWEPNES